MSLLDRSDGAVQEASAIEGNGIGEGCGVVEIDDPIIHGGLGRGLVRLVEIEVRAVQVEDDPFGVNQVGEASEVELASGLERGQAGRTTAGGGIQDEPGVALEVLEDLRSAGSAVSRHQDAGSDAPDDLERREVPGNGATHQQRRAAVEHEVAREE